MDVSPRSAQPLVDGFVPQARIDEAVETLRGRGGEQPTEDAKAGDWATELASTLIPCALGAATLDWVDRVAMVLRRVVAQPPIAPTVIPQVLALAQAMQFKLDKNAHKGGWQIYDDNGVRIWDRSMLAFLKDKLIEEIDELFTEVPDGDKEAIRYEAADVANLAMMIADVCRAFDEAAIVSDTLVAEHVYGGNCFRGVDYTTCYAHKQRRGHCSECALCPACSTEPVAEQVAPALNEINLIRKAIADGNGIVHKDAALLLKEHDSQVSRADFWQEQRVAVVDPSTLSAERAAEILNLNRYRGVADWYGGITYCGSSGVASGTISLSDAQIIAVWLLEHGGGEVRK